MENDTSYNLPESQKDQLTDIELNHDIITTKKGPIKRKKTKNMEEISEIKRTNSTFTSSKKYENKAFMNHDEVELFYLSMAKIAKRLPKAKEAKLRMEVCNTVSEAELAYLLEVENMQQKS